MYIEGYFWEGLIGNDGSKPAVGSGGTGVQERKQSVTFSGHPGEAAAFGFKETTI